MKTKTYGVAVLFLLTNFIWGYLFFHAHKTSEHYPHVELYTLEGNGVYWQVKDYQIIVTPEKIERGHARLTYLGNPNEIEHSDFCSISFYEGSPHDEQQVVYSYSVSAPGGNAHIIENVKNIGSISGPYDYLEAVKTRNDYANSYVQIIWNDSEGIERQERIELEIVNHFNLEAFIQ